MLTPVTRLALARRSRAGRFKITVTVQTEGLRCWYGRPVSAVLIRRR
jgi:hypothetical protein